MGICSSQSQKNKEKPTENKKFDSTKEEQQKPENLTQNNQQKQDIQGDTGGLVTV